MVKAEKLRNQGTPFLTSDDVKGAIAATGKAVIVIDSEAKLEHSEKFDNDRYVAEITIFMGKNKTKPEQRKWTMNATSSDFLIDKLGEDTADWTGKQVELDIVRTATPDGMKYVIYPEGAAEEK